MKAVLVVLLSVASLAHAAARPKPRTPNGVVCTSIADNPDYQQTICAVTLGGRTRYTMQEHGYGANELFARSASMNTSGS